VHLGKPLEPAEETAIWRRWLRALGRSLLDGRLAHISPDCQLVYNLPVLKYHGYGQVRIHWLEGALLSRSGLPQKCSESEHTVQDGGRLRKAQRDEGPTQRWSDDKLLSYTGLAMPAPTTTLEKIG
jgi:hypothetical protein